MGKTVVCANHPSNEFFKQFPNCHMYNNGDEFVKQTLKALAEEPAPLTDDLRHELSWEAATERFIRVTEINDVVSESPILSPSKPFMFVSSNGWMNSLGEASAMLHNTVSGIEVARRAFGAIPKTLQPDEQQRKELGLSSQEQKKFVKR